MNDTPRIPSTDPSTTGSSAESSASAVVSAEISVPVNVPADIPTPAAVPATGLGLMPTPADISGDETQYVLPGVPPPAAGIQAQAEEVAEPDMSGPTPGQLPLIAMPEGHEPVSAGATATVVLPTTGATGAVPYPFAAGATDDPDSVRKIAPAAGVTETASVQTNAPAGTGTMQSGTPAGTAAQQSKKQPKGFFATYPVRLVPPSMPASIGSRLFNLMAYAPWLVLILMLAAQTVFSLDSRTLWFSDEVRHADVFRNLLEHGRGIVLQLNGQDYLDKPPLYFWFLRGLYVFIPVEGPLLYFTGAAVSALAFLLSFLLLGRFVDRADGRTLLASGIVLLCGGYVYGLMHYARMDFLFSAFIVCSYTALYHALIRPRSFGFSFLAFALAGVACLIKGPLGLLLPLAAGLFFVLWKTQLRRLFRLDIGLGLLVALCIVGAWAVMICLDTGSTDILVREVWQKQILGRAVNSFAHKQPFWYYLPGLPLALLPFSLLLFCLPWLRMFSSGARARLVSLRTPAGDGTAFLWCMALSALLLLSSVSAKILIYYLPALPALALLLGRAMLELAGGRALLFRWSTALLMVLGGVVFLVVSLVFFGAFSLPFDLGLPAWRISGSPAFYLVGFGLMAGGLFILFVLRRSQPEGVLLAFAACMTLLSYPLARDVAPAFDAVLSPKAQSLVMKKYIEQGYAPYSYKNYPAIYTYYAEAVVKDIDSLAELPTLPAEQGVILAIRRKDLREWPGKPTCFKEVDARYIEHPERVLLACPGKSTAAPAGSPPPSVGDPLPVEEGKAGPVPPPPAGDGVSTSTAPTVGEGEAPAVSETPVAPGTPAGHEVPATAKSASDQAPAVEEKGETPGLTGGEGQSPASPLAPGAESTPKQAPPSADQQNAVPALGLTPNPDSAAVPEIQPR